ncbi:hypothetical protein HNP84_006606 [Thermocatellispora tengchongensis]|uniref:SnoaL-like domain-containing protein n=1 Tax=Thermocatellispora tengchongensis TaxID=1073253 RepID=A0A840PLC7_9ACTN|nr:nuclear transport factor 2 family protein [Thermocatellispora tengchongensis]MBB5136855.1 hypothetical protein [Thermocatellispora tengchongensis]
MHTDAPDHDAVDRFWTGLRTRDLGLIRSALADDVERIGLWYGGPDTVIGRDLYLSMFERVFRDYAHWSIEPSTVIRSADGRTAVAHCREELRRTADAELTELHELIETTLDDSGLIRRVDIFFKIAPGYARVIADRYPS